MNRRDELNQTISLIDVADHLARKKSATVAKLPPAIEVQPVNAELPDQICENGVCTVSWKPERPAA